MRALIELILSFLDLLKAELAQSRAEIVRLLLTFVCLEASMLIFVGAMGLLFAAMITSLNAIMPIALAILVTSLCALGVAVIMFYIGLWRGRS